MLLRHCLLPSAIVLLFACGPDSPNANCEAAVAGAGCSQDGQVCDAGADLCVEHSALACKSGSWQEQVIAPIECDTGASTDSGMTTGTSTPTTTATTSAATSDATTTAATSEATTGGPVACDPQNIPAEGSACAMEGETCSPGCEDPCMFCNVVQCEGGKWQALEVFPADCPSCDVVCPFVVAAGCAGGPPDQASCVVGCQDAEAGDCQIPYHQSLACAGSQATFSCDAMGRPTVAGCEPQFDNFYMCAGL
jgi:hypothetical protein